MMSNPDFCDCPKCVPWHRGPAEYNLTTTNVLLPSHFEGLWRIPPAAGGSNSLAKKQAVFRGPVFFCGPSMIHFFRLANTRTKFTKNVYGEHGVPYAPACKGGQFSSSRAAQGRVAEGFCVLRRLGPLPVKPAQLGVAADFVKLTRCRGSCQAHATCGLCFSLPWV